MLDFFDDLLFLFETFYDSIVICLSSSNTELFRGKV